jgi:hypothetical protein
MRKDLMEVDFIHIDFHKTASTYLQQQVFAQIDDLEIINSNNFEMDTWFYKNFINLNPHSFCKEEFIDNFYDIVVENRNSKK